MRRFQIILGLALVLGVLGCGSKPTHQNIIEAVLADDAEDVRKHLELGADPNTIYSRLPVPVFDTPILTLATKQANPDIVRILIEHGADVNALDGLKKTALDQVVMLFAKANINIKSPAYDPRIIQDHEVAMRLESIRVMLMEHGAQFIEHRDVREVR